MKVHIAQIPEGDTLHLEGEEDTARLGLEEAGAVPVSPLHYSLDVGLSHGGFFATGSLAVRVRLSCVACLEDFEVELQVPDFAMQEDLHHAEQIDLIPQVREDILLVMPAYPRCDAGGTRSCPATFRSEPNKSLHEEPQGTSSVWDALNHLNKEE